MKITTKLTIAFLFLINSTTAQVDNFETISWTSLSLKGKVKEIKAQLFKAQDKFGELQKVDKELSNEYYHFNDNGFAIERNYGLKWIMKYDSLGNKIEQTVYNTRQDKTEFIWSKKIWIYDKSSKLTEQNFYEKEGTLSQKVIYKYDLIGNLVEQAIYDKNGNIVTKTLYTYDKDGKLIESLFYDKDGNNTGKFQYTYGKNGRILKENSYTKSSNTDYTMDKLYSYDINGNLSQKIEYRISSILYNGNKTIKKWTGIESYKYNEKSELIEYTNTTGFDDGASSIEIVKYEFDSNSNWIRKTNYNKSNSDYKNTIEERVITYYHP